MSKTRSEYERLLSDLERLGLIVESLNTRIHNLIDEHDVQITKMKIKHLDDEGKLP